MNASPDQTNPNFYVRNSAEPIPLVALEVSGVAGHSARVGETVRIITRMGMISDDHGFHDIAENFCSQIRYSAEKSGRSVKLADANTILVVLKNDHTAKLWINTVAMSLNVIARRDLLAFSEIYSDDMADITGLDFPDVEIEATDGIIYLFRQGWRFALYFDFNSEANFDRPMMVKNLGRLYRVMKHRHLYDVMANKPFFDRLVGLGWFPFVEIIGREFQQLSETNVIESNLTETELAIVNSFDENRLQGMLDRWMSKSHFSEKRALLQEAINAYIKRMPAAVIKIVLTEIEGVLREAYKNTHGNAVKIEPLLEFAIKAGTQKSGASDTLFFTETFAHYLESVTFADFDPNAAAGDAGSRHAVGHGAAETASYTMTRALQSILTLDQICFYS